MIALTTNQRGPAPQNTWSAQDGDADEEDNTHSASGAESSPPSGNENDPPRPHGEGMFQGTYPIEQSRASGHTNAQQRDDQPGHYQRVDRSEHVPEDHVDSQYYSQEMDFDNARRDEMMEEDALGEWERYVQDHQSSTSATSSDESHTTPLTFE